MVKHIGRALAISAVIGILATSTQGVRAAEHGNGSDARHGHIKMTFSGSMVPTAIDVQPDTITDEELVAGNGTLGRFTFRKLRTDETTPQSFGSCGDGFGPSLRVTAGGGVFRFEDGSLLTVMVTDGDLCIDFDHVVGHLTEAYQITGGTGRFEGASGTLQSTADVKPVLFSVSNPNAAVLLTLTGELKGTVQLP
jgi:hypothetical protein